MALSDMFPPEAFVWGAGGAKKTPEQIAREREIAEALMAQGIDTSPVYHPLQGAARVANAAAGAFGRYRADKAERGNAEYSQGLIQSLMGGMGGGATSGGGASFPPAPGGGAPQVSAGPSTYRDAIASIESAGSGDYQAVGPTHPKMGRALGRYQVMEANLGPWGKEAIGRPVTAEEFLANPSLQDAIFDAKFGSYVQKYGPEGAAQAWFAGPGGVGKGSRKDVLGTSVDDYAARFRRALGTAPAAPAAAVPTQVASLDPSIGMPPDAPSGGLGPGVHGEVRMGPNGQPVKYIGGMDGAPGDWGQTLDAPTQTAGIGIGPAPTPPVQPTQVPPVAPMPVPGVDVPQQAPQPVQQVAQAMPREEMSGNVDVQQPQGGMGGLNPAIMEALTSPYANENVRGIAEILLQQQLQQQDPMRQLQMQQLQMEIEQARNPKPEYNFMSGRDGSIFRTTKSGDLEQVYGGKPDLPSDVQEYEYARGQGYQGSFADWQIENKKAGASQVNIDQRAEGAFEKKAAEGQAEVFNTMSSEGMNARADLGVIGELETLLAGQGGTMTGIAGLAAKYGIGGEGMSDIQAAQALINKLVPTQRQAGSGSMSDRDVELFTRSLPNLWNSPQGNQKIIKVMRGLAQYKQDQGEIADMVLMGEMTRQEGRKALRDLPNPLEEFRNMPAESVGPPEGIDPQDWEFLTPEERKLFQ